MHTCRLLTSLFQYKAWANQELFAELQRLPPATLRFYRSAGFDQHAKQAFIAKPVE